MMKFSIVHPIYPIAFPECGAIIGGIESIITICKMKKILTVLLTLSVALLAGCGQSGALYIPDDAQQSEQPQ
ncbi:lipopeptide [Vibrio vulnificus]|uniref:Lipopeptide n=2 Tax=Vibrio vulnificus TaxID=672 RepID=A0A087JTZ6_VIBVL|nr:lipopeptide [Vibrio vulnificus]ASM96396.1 lipopeptide [Vibrio vulnificus NBRC 15645 = ATCC 27562]AVX00459.1 lipopeptide [Vibrio vulnificus Env1]OZT84981.1 lipopeptide [Vibrio sp. 03_296]EGQ7694952.1 lipoprotein [Vibrio vulnificus]